MHSWPAGSMETPPGGGCAWKAVLTARGSQPGKNKLRLPQPIFRMPRPGFLDYRRGNGEVGWKHDELAPQRLPGPEIQWPDPDPESLAKRSNRLDDCVGDRRVDRRFLCGERSSAQVLWSPPDGPVGLPVGTPDRQRRQPADQRLRTEFPEIGRA